MPEVKKVIATQSDDTFDYSVVFRYIVLVLLYVITFIYIYKIHTQFVLFIVFFILSFFTILFLYKDLFSIPLLSRYFFSSPLNFGFSGENSYNKIYIILLFITLLLNLSTISIILAVFDYGKKSTNSYSSYSMLGSNNTLLKDIKLNFQSYMANLAMFVVFITYIYSSDNIKKYMEILIGFIFASSLIYSSIINCISAVKFLQIRKKKRQLYHKKGPIK